MSWEESPPLVPQGVGRHRAAAPQGATPHEVLAVSPAETVWKRPGCPGPSLHDHPVALRSCLWLAASLNSRRFCLWGLEGLEGASISSILCSGKGVSGPERCRKIIRGCTESWGRDRT